ncbi:MAG: sigma-70 family RNA polymerase sigma factor [Bacteroidetes bacterium]|nr:sigma-70 family RNA polymerase sigma factor [Bacteroidota bacterium]
MSEELSDKELLERFRHPDTRNYSFNLLVRKYQQKVYWHIRRIVIDHDDANDVTQETFVKVWKNLDNFKEEAQLFTWIYRIATNEALSFLRKKRNKFFIPIINVENKLANSLKDDNFFSGDDIQLKLQQAILKLPEKQRIVFNMKYYDELKYEEMSAVTGTSVGALKASYHFAVKKIEEYIKSN